MPYLLILLLLLTGCASAGIRTSDEANVPTSYKADLVAFLRTYLNDPTQVREAAIAEPRLRAVGPETRWTACLRYNARDSIGKYSGVRERLAVYYRGRFDRLIENAREQCKDVVYAPFPELERLTR
jgi:hypothetical protein